MIVLAGEDIVAVTTLLSELLFAFMLEKRIDDLLGGGKPRKRGRGKVGTSLPLSLLLTLNSQFLIISSYHFPLFI